MSLSCLHCSKPLIKYQKKYCSFSCQRKQNIADGIPSNLSSYNRPKKIKPQKKCLNVLCETLTTNPKFCSEKCSSGSRKLTKKEHLARKNNNWYRYQMRKKQQMPPWANLDKIKEIYLNCPKGYEVDHIHPISKGGLHVDYNLQYLTISENRSKNNKI